MQPTHGTNTIMLKHAFRDAIILVFGVMWYALLLASGRSLAHKTMHPTCSYVVCTIQARRVYFSRTRVELRRVVWRLSHNWTLYMLRSDTICRTTGLKFELWFMMFHVIKRNILNYSRIREQFFSIQVIRNLFVNACFKSICYSVFNFGIYLISNDKNTGRTCYKLSHFFFYVECITQMWLQCYKWR